MKNLTKVISGLVIGGAIITTGTTAMAANTSTTSQSIDIKGRPAIAGKMMKGDGRGKGFFKKGFESKDITTNLKTLVTAGIITQAESDKIQALSDQLATARQAEMDKIKSMIDAERKAYLEAQKAQAAKPNDIFTQAVTNGIITQDKADAAKAKLQELRASQEKSEVTNALSSLVTAGTITQDQADKVAAYIASLKDTRPAPGTAPAAGTITTPGTQVQKTNPLTALVTNGTLTQTQLDAISKVLPFGRGHGPGGQGGHGGHGGHGGDRTNTRTTTTTTNATSSGINE